ncbi:MAG: class I SAM-dependent methyltransferase [Gammaproteobacteria bacterium]|nr:class I SAM-dependent methyltransferase [Gammaproteobacteria bacterium]MCP4089057.1 class I SAM-dependent methyltransferase [Gammaproteobacteria bacterium]MCP4278043.1 class I SAM-dependent methyltransferase [Gammaproteobacteria bacterium]MCP4833019.1 class I SAM-dependent methyltransferase [Gammaproteobacteria bacterium]MCP4929260.1 class I SAM-dependent methyltransferase [Gammaproteobacteria bacterium]
MIILLQGCEKNSVTPSSIVVDKKADDKLAAILAGEHRSDEHKARDKFRHPAETLSFFSVTPDASVVEIWPGGGWYTEILAPYLRDEGRYIAAGFDPESDIEFIRIAAGKYQSKLDANPELYDKVETVVLMPPNQLDFVPPDSVDVVLTFRSVHNWMPRNAQGVMFQAIYTALKPGGVLGVVEHRGNPAIPQDPKAATGYVNQDYVIELAESAGFVLNGSSEINANLADTKDHPEGVWTLPPTLRMKEQGKETWLSIGESDRLTLRFIKPVN